MSKEQDLIEKLSRQNADLRLKIAANDRRIREAIGKLAGVKEGTVVVAAGVRYSVSEVLSETVPKNGVPSLSVFKIAKNGNVAKRAVVLAKGWKVETAEVAPVKAAAKRGRKPSKAAGKRVGRPRKVAELAATLAAGNA